MNLADADSGVRDALGASRVVLVEREAGLALSAHACQVLAAAAVQGAHLASVLASHEVPLDTLVAVGATVVPVHAPWDVAGDAGGLAGQCGAEVNVAGDVIVQSVGNALAGGAAPVEVGAP